MRRVVPVLVTVATLVVAASAQVADVSGTWDLEMMWPDATSTGGCTFQQDGERLTGTCGAGVDRFPLTGRIVGNRLSWRVDVTQDGSTGRMEFDGELDQQGSTIRGSCRIVDANSGTFVMKRTG